jgi:hypothetical protein
MRCSVRGLMKLNLNSGELTSHAREHGWGRNGRRFLKKGSVDYKRVPELMWRRLSSNTEGGEGGGTRYLGRLTRWYWHVQVPQLSASSVRLNFDCEFRGGHQGARPFLNDPVRV